MAQQYGPKIITDGLVLSLDAADKNSYPGSGTTWSDLSGNGNNGTLTNGPTFDSGNGGCIDFDGVNDSVSLGNNVSTQIGQLGSVEAWVYPESDKWMYFFFKGYGSANSLFLGYHSSPKQWFFGTYANSAYKYNYWGNGGDYSAYHGNKWHHLVMTFNGSLVSDNWLFYWNGSQKASTDWTSDLGTVNTSAYLSASRYWVGKIGIFKIYNKALSAKEVSQNFNAQRHRFGI